jgi:hypothetical protein
LPNSTRGTARVAWLVGEFLGYATQSFRIIILPASWTE